MPQVAMVITMFAYTQQWLTKLGLMKIFPELPEEVAAPILGLVSAVLASRSFAIYKEMKEKTS